MAASGEVDKHAVAWLDLSQGWAVERAVQQHEAPIVPGAARAARMGLSLVVVGKAGPEPVGYRAAEFEPTKLGVEACF